MRRRLPGHHGLQAGDGGGHRGPRPPRQPVLVSTARHRSRREEGQLTCDGSGATRAGMALPMVIGTLTLMLGISVMATQEGRPPRRDLEPRTATPRRRWPPPRRACRPPSTGSRRSAPADNMCVTNAAVAPLANGKCPGFTERSETARATPTTRPPAGRSGDLRRLGGAGPARSAASPRPEPPTDHAAGAGAGERRTRIPAGQGPAGARRRGDRKQLRRGRQRRLQRHHQDGQQQQHRPRRPRPRRPPCSGNPSSQSHPS